MLKEEWKNIFHSAWIKVVLVAIILIPSIYSCVFLGSMWDPYGNSGDLPVAVVNEDQEVTFNDKKMCVGKELVSNLKENDALDFNFTSANKAKKGLKDGDYYMVITIPKDFSKNATTLLDEKPEKMVLDYTTNPGTNFVASKMDDTAMAKIKEQVSASVTKTYAKTIFNQIDTLSNGLSDASDGTQSLEDGLNQLSDGNKTISDNLKVLASSSLTFKDGSSTLTKGIKDYTDGVVSVQNGAYSLKSGLDTLNNSTGSLTNGVNSLNNGANAINDGANKLAQGVASLSEGNQQVVNGLGQLSDALKQSLSSDNQAAINKAMNANDSLEGANKLLTALLNNPLSKDAGIAWMSNPLDSATVGALGITDQQQAYLLTNYSYNGLLETVTSGNKQAINQLVTGLNTINQAVNGGGSAGVGLAQGSKTVQAGITQIQASVVGGSYQSVDGNGQVITNTVEPANSLVGGSAALASGLGDLKNSIPTLTNGVQALVNGADTLYSGTQALTSNNQTLVSGSSQLDDGANQISDGANQLAQGSDTLGSGLQDAKEGTTTLNDALREGANESKLTTTDDTDDMMASPVELTHDEISVVPNNGHAMAPYMMSVALYVCALAFTLMYPVREGIKNAKSGLKYWASKASVMYLVSTVAAIVMVSALILINGFAPENVFMTYLFAILVSGAFMSVVLLLNVTTGYIGEFLLLVFMIVNLGGSAGTYPLETSSWIYQAIHKFVPYTYSVDGFRKTLSTSSPIISTEIIVFIGIFIGCTILTILYYRFKNKDDKHLIPEMFEKHE